MAEKKKPSKSEIQDESGQQELSVLDYILARITFWRGTSIQLPESEDNQEVGFVDYWTHQEEVEVTDKTSIFNFGFPWLTAVVLFLALLAQALLWFSNEMTSMAVTLFVSVAAIVLYMQRKGDLDITALRPQENQEDDLLARWPFLLSGLIFGGWAYWLFGGDYLFTPLNVSLWLISLISFVLAFWRGQVDLLAPLKKFVDTIQQGEWQLNIKGWHIAFVVSLIVGIYFRFHQFGEVVPEMFSDQTEKLYDVMDILNGSPRTYFPRNTGREPFQFYLIAWTIQLLNTGISYASMKIGTILMGVLTLPYMYLLGKEAGNKMVGIYAMFFMGISTWINILARVALRFVLYSTFVAPVLYHLFRGLRTSNRKQFMWAGFFLGWGLLGYSPYRVVPLLVVIAFALFLLHAQSKGVRQSAGLWLGLVALIAVVVILPLARYWIDNPDIVNYRMASRMTTLERDYPEPVGSIFFNNVKDGLLMMNYNNGDVWVSSLHNRPGLGVVSGALFVLGVIFVLGRYVRERNWQDLFYLIAIPVLMLPSTLALAFPEENPAPNRASGVLVIVFLLVGFGMDALIRNFDEKMQNNAGKQISFWLAISLMFIAAANNYNMTFNQFKDQISGFGWNTRELGGIIADFANGVGTRDSAWVVANPHWVDTRLVGINAGFPEKNYEIWPEVLDTTLEVPGPKLFLVRGTDDVGLATLETLYPNGSSTYRETELEGKEFYIFYVPPERTINP